MATNVHLTSELEQFAKSCVADGRYNNVSEVVRAGLRLLAAEEARRAAFERMLAAATAEADREGTIALETALAEMDAIIGDADR